MTSFEALSVASLGQAGPALWLSERECVYPTGNGLIGLQVDSGAQRHLWCSGNKSVGGSGGIPLLAVCPERQLLAYAQNSADASIFIAAAADFQTVGLIKDTSRESSWCHFSFSRDGSRLASISGLPHHNLDLWDVDSASQAPGAGFGARSVARVRLGPRLVDLPPCFFPFNPNVVALAGRLAVRIVALEPLLSGLVVHQSDVDLSALDLDHEETVTSVAWSPHGALLLGTSLGRVLAVPRAAPAAIIEPGWGLGPQSHVAHVLFSPANLQEAPTPPRSENSQDSAQGLPAAAGSGSFSTAGRAFGPVVGLFCSKDQVVGVLGGTPSSQEPAHMLWLEGGKPGYPLTALAPLPMQDACAATVSPGLLSVLVYTQSGRMYLADTTFTKPQPSSGPGYTFDEVPSISSGPSLLGAMRSSFSGAGNVRPSSGTGGGSKSNSSMGGQQPKSRPDSSQAGTARKGKGIQFSDIPEDGVLPERSEDGVFEDADIAGADQGNGGTGSTVLPGALEATLVAKALTVGHVGPVLGVVQLPRELFATGGQDGTVRLWHYTLPDPQASISQIAAGPSLTVQPMAVWSFGCPVTFMCNYTKQGSSAIIAGTNDGAIHVLSGDRAAEFNSASAVAARQAASAAYAASGAGDDAEDDGPGTAAHALKPVWEQRPFDGPLTSLAFSAEGDHCAACCASQNLVVFYRVLSGASQYSEITMQLLGFYQVHHPQLLAWAPRDLVPPTDGNPKPPMLVVSCTNGEIQILQPPTSLSHLRESENALIKPGTLLQGWLRAQGIVTAIVTAPDPGSTGGTAESTFLVFACCSDKSIRRFKVPTEQHRVAAKGQAAAQEARALGRQLSATNRHGGGMGAQNFQMPDSEKPMELPSPASHAVLSPSGKHMTVTTICGTTLLYSIPEMAQQARWMLHAPMDPSETALVASLAGTAGPLPTQAQQYARCGASALGPRTLITTGYDGLVHIFEYTTSSSLAQARSRQPSSTKVDHAGPSICMNVRMAFPPGLGSASPGVGAPTPLHQALAQPIAANLPSKSRVHGWREARIATQRHAKASEIRNFTEQVMRKKEAWETRLAELRERNEAAEESERLPPAEFVVNQGLQQELLTKADVVVAAARTAAQKEAVVPEVVRHRLMGVFTAGLETPQELLTALPEVQFQSTLTAEDQKRWKDAGAPIKVEAVHSYAVRKPSLHEQAVLRKVTFLRRVEQAEWEEAPSEQRGQVATLRKWKGSMVGRGYSISGMDTATEGSVHGGEGAPEGQQQAIAAPAPDDEDEDEEDFGMTASRADGDDIEGNEIYNGCTGLLYTALQLHAPLRKAAQAVLLQEECRSLQRTFNTKFKELVVARDKEVDKWEERAARITEIQKELALPPPVRPAGLITHHDGPGSHIQAALQVKDEEVQVEKWVSPEERAKRAAAAKAAEEARRRAEADDSRNRALKEMMNATLEAKRAAAAADELVREPWMDLPRAQLTVDQRKTLAEWEKRAMELAEEKEKARRQLEGERKALEVDIMDQVYEFNNRLAALAGAKIKVDVELRAAERHALDCALAVEELRAAAAARQAVALSSEKLVEARSRTSTLLQEARKAQEAALKEYETLAGQERAMDKALRRELAAGREDDLLDVLLRFYKDRKRGLSGQPVRPPAEILGKVPEGQGQAPPEPSRTFERRASYLAEAMLGQGPAPAEPYTNPPEPHPLPQLERWLAGLRTAVAKHSKESGEEVHEGGAHAHGASSAAIMAHLAADHLARAVAVTPIEHLLALAEGGSARPMGPLFTALANGESLAAMLPASGAAPAAEESAATLDLGLGAAGLGLASEGQSKAAVAAAAATGSDPFSITSGPVVTALKPGAVPIVASAAEAVAAVEGAGAEPLSGSPLGPKDKPAECEEVWWVRMLEFRDSRIGLEKAADEAWGKLLWATLAVARLEREEADAEEELGHASEAAIALREGELRTAADVLLLYRLTHGQVELPKAETAGGALTAMADADLVHRQRVEGLNSIILERGGRKLEVLNQLKSVTAAIHLARWEVGRTELRIRHAGEELTELQLLSVTKDLQTVLRDPSALQRLDIEAKLVSLAEAQAASHNARVQMKATQLARLTERITANIQAHEELGVAKSAAEVAAKERARVATVLQRRKADEEAAQRRAMRAIVTNVQLKDIAQAQAAELRALAAQLDVLKARTFPALHQQGMTSPGPDLRLPPTVSSRSPSPTARRLLSAQQYAYQHYGSPSGSTGSIGAVMASPTRPYTVPAGIGRPLSGTSPTASPQSSKQLPPRPGTVVGARRRQ